EELFRGGDIKIFLVIHYFGFVQNEITLLKSLCEKYKVILVEDCAHAYTFGRRNLQLGYYGDFSFFSLHKFFPVESGGILLINNKAHRLSHIVDEDKCEEHVSNHILVSDCDEIRKVRFDNYQYLLTKLKGIETIKSLYSLKQLIVPHSFPVFIEGLSRE